MGKQSRVLMISIHGHVAAQPELGRPDTGGQVVYVLEVAKCLARMGYNVDILTRRFDDQRAVESISDGMRILRFPCGGNKFIPKEDLCEAIPEWCHHTRQALRGREDEIACVSTHYWDAGLAGMRLAKQLSVPHVHTPHSLGAWKRDSMPGSADEKERRYNFRRRIRDERMIYHDCEVLIATTPQQHTLLCGGDYLVHPEKPLVIPPGYDDHRFFPISATSRRLVKRELGLEGLFVLALGRMARNKGYDLLVRSMIPVFQRIPDAKLLLAVGASSPSYDEIRQIRDLKLLAVELGVEKQVIIRNYIHDDQLASYYRAADVFALSSRYEPFGMTAIEAMACGTPTVITTEGGLWEQVTWGMEAIYANPNSPEEFGHAVCQILSYPQVAAQLAEHGARKARACFTWAAVTQQIVDATSQVLHDRTVRLHVDDCDVAAYPVA